MRVQADPIYLEEHAMSQISRIDQLTLVRNYVRRWWRANPRDSERNLVTEVEVEVVWLDGEVENCVFDKVIGFPITTQRDWYGEWIKESTP